MPEGEGGGDFMRMLERMFSKLKEKSDDEFDVLGPLSDADRAEWIAIKQAHAVIVNKAKALQAEQDMNDARRKMLWTKIESDTGIFDKNMRINDEYMLLVEKEKEEKKGCDGECHSCGSEDPFPEDE